MVRRCGYEEFLGGSNTPRIPGWDLNANVSCKRNYSKLVRICFVEKEQDVSVCNRKR